MKKIKNPNDIVESFVSDYRTVFNETLVSVVLYGSAVTHEYKPGKSDINIVVILSDNSISNIKLCQKIQKKWSEFRVTTPFYMTPDFIIKASDTYPLEFIDIRSNYRVLFGEDLFQKMEFQSEHIRLQCERELRGFSLHLKRAYIEFAQDKTQLSKLLKTSISRIIPIFKGLLVLKTRVIPKSKADIISAIEDCYNLGASILSRIYLSDAKKLVQQHVMIFESYTQIIDSLINSIDNKKGSA
jgi:predicted nucleotidyltransferase